MAAEETISSIQTNVCFFGTSQTKIQCADIHPVFPYVVSSDRQGHVVLWDYHTHHIILEFSIKHLDDTNQRNAFHTQLLRKDAKSVKQPEEKLGHIIACKFLDNDNTRYNAGTLMHKWRQQWFGANGDNVQPRWIVLVTEYRVILYNYVTLRSTEIKSSLHLENKAITAFDFFKVGVTAPWVVFGCNDGVIRLFNYIQIWDRHAAPRCEKKIESRSKSPVSSIVAFQKASVAEKDGDGCCLIVALQDGTIVIIDIKTNTHTTLQKVHSGDSILSITACPRRGIFSTLGADKARFVLTHTIAAFSQDCASSADVSKLKLVGKRSFTQIQSVGSHPLFKRSAVIVCEKGPKVFALTMKSPALVELFDLAQMLSIRNIKIYEMIVNPCNPAFVLCSTNFGVVVVAMDRYHLQPHGNLLGQLLVYSEDDHMVMDQVDLRFSPPLGNNWGKDMERNQAFVIKKHVLCFSPEITMSKSALFLALMWQHSAEYCIIELATGMIVDEGAAVGFAWCSATFEGTSTMDYFAVASPAPRQSSASAQEEMKSKRQSVSLATGGISKLTRGPQAINTLKIKAINMTTKKISDVHTLSLPGQPTAIFGGSMLSIVFNGNSSGGSNAPSSSSSGGDSAPAHNRSAPLAGANPDKPGGSFRGGGALKQSAPAAPAASTAPSTSSVSSSSSSTSAAAATLQFVPWFTVTAPEPTVISTQLPPPHNIIWEPSQDFVVLVYSHEFVVFSALHKLKFLSRVPLQITSGIWVNKTFFFATLQSVACYFPHVSNRTCVLLANVHQAVLSAFSDSSYSNMGSSMGTTVSGSGVASSNSWSFSGAGLAEGVGNIFTTAGGSAINRKPVGPVRILGLFDQALIMVDSYFDIHHLTLTNPNLKAILCRMLISAGVVDKGLGWARTLPISQQDDIAVFLYQRGLGSDALSLPAINEWLKFHLQALETAERIAAAAAAAHAQAAAAAAAAAKAALPDSASAAAENGMGASSGGNGDDDKNSGGNGQRESSHAMTEMSSYDLYSIEDHDDAGFLAFITTCKKPAQVQKEDVVRLFVLLADRCDDEAIALKALSAAAKIDKLVKDQRHMLMALLRSNRQPEAAEFASRDPQLQRLAPSIVQKWGESLPPGVQVSRQ